MKLAIMQPYLLPYIGYWQLLAAADKFIILDDVAFIPRGWIHRNRILLNGEAHLFTLPVSGASQNKLICDIERADSTAWQRKFFASLQQSYRHSPHYSATRPLLEEIFSNPDKNLSRFICNSLSLVANHLDISTETVLASQVHDKGDLKGQDRILALCRQEAADTYLNPPGGVELYDRATFDQAGITLKFLQPTALPYPQGTDEFIPWLSIIDVLMNAGRDRARAMLADCSFT